jgi:hypothetical protein
MTVNNSESKKLLPFPVQTMEDYPKFDPEVYFRLICVSEVPCSGLGKGKGFPRSFLKNEFLLPAEIFMRLILGIHLQLFSNFNKN